MAKILLILFVMCGVMVVAATEMIEKFIFFGFGIGTLSMFIIWRVFESTQLKAMEELLFKKLQVLKHWQEKKNKEIDKEQATHNETLKNVKGEISKIRNSVADIAMRTGIDSIDNH